MSDEKLNASQKALAINLDAAKYGTFAEIGAGQETARWFFRVGGAAGTVAKTISAYDMTVSDAIYGPAQRYVSRQRLQAMLDHEWGLLLERLGQPRGDKSTFFVFANTVATRSFTRKEEGHGWLGVKFQTQPHEPPSQIIIHVRMLDTENSREQEALGIAGVNLIHGAFALHGGPAKLIGALLDDLSRQRIEVDMIKFSGPRFAGLDNRLMALQLVEQGLTDATIFTAAGETVVPAELLYKKPVLVERGSFRPVTRTTLDILDRAREEFLAAPQLQGESPVELMEMTLRSVLADASLAPRDFLDRADLLAALGKTVLISNFGRHYRLVAYLARHTAKMQGLALGVPSLIRLFDEKYYADLDGGLLEAMGRLFKGASRFYVYPQLDAATGKIITADTLQVAPHLRHLYAHLLENGCIVPLKKFDPARLAENPPQVLKKIQTGDATWEAAVPPEVVPLIKEKTLFGWGAA